MENNNDKINISANIKMKYILKRILYSIFVGLYWLVMIRISRTGIIGSIVGLIMAIILCVNKNFNLASGYNNELGKHTKTITIAIEITTVTILYIGVYFTSKLF
ncbi:MAG: hypothetical protein AB6733_02585 [Clostridiaceae bacterium]